MWRARHRPGGFGKKGRPILALGGTTQSSYDYLGWLPPVLAELQRDGGQTLGWEARGPQLRQKEAPRLPPSRAPSQPLPSARIIHHVFPKPCQALGSLLAEEGPRQDEVDRAD